MLTRYFLSFLFLVLIATSPADAQYLFDNLGTKDGISSREIRTIFRDKQGFIWIGTAYGINRFDGSQFKTWNHSNPAYPGQLGQTVNGFAEYGKDQIWFGTDAGVGVFDKTTVSFRVVTIRYPGAGADKKIYASRFQLDRAGHLWLSTSEGIFIEKEGVFVPVSTVFPFAKEADPLICHYTSFLYDSARNTIWAGTLGKGLYSIDLDQKKVFSVTNNPAQLPFLRGQSVISMAFDPKGNIWWGEQDALCYYDFATKKSDRITRINNNPEWELGGGPNSLFVDKKGRLWISTWLYTAFVRRTDGVFEQVPYDKDVPHSIGYGFFFDVMEDSYGTLWFATINGVSRMSSNPFVRNIVKVPSYEFYLPTGFANINVVTPGVKGIWWLGKMEGLVRYDSVRHGFELFTPFPGINRWNEIHDIDTIDNEIWCGTSNGIHIFNPATKKFRPFAYYPKDKGNAAKPISWVYRDSKGFIWSSVWNDAVYRFDPRTKTCTRFDGTDPATGDMSAAYSVSFYETSEQKIWVSSWINGIRIFDMQTGRFNTPPDERLQTDVANSIAEDRNGFIWISTSRNTIIKCSKEGNVLDSVTTKQGLTGNRFADFCFDDAGRLWAISREGLICVETATRRIIPVKIDVTYSFNDHWNSLLKVGDKLYAAMLDNVVIIDPAKFQQLPALESPLISGFRVFQDDRAFNSATPVNLNYKENFFSIDFSSPFHRDYSSIQYAYQLEGFDKDWVYCGRRQTADYTNVPHGRYTFRVKSTDGGNTWMERNSSISIYIKPPFWKTIWFKILLLLLAVATAWKLYSNRQRARKKKGIDNTIDYFANSVYGENSVNEICWDIARNCISQLQFEDCVVYLRDEETGRFVQKAAYGPKNPKGHEITDPIEIEPGMGIVGAAASSGKPVLVNDTSRDSRYIVDDEARFSELAVPVLHDGKVIGVIDSEHRKKNFFTEEHVKALSTIASISANKIAEAQAEAHAKENEIKLLGINKQLAESQLMALRAQMNPHFVFNCLNSIQECIVTQKYGEASNYLNKFSKLFRTVLNNSGKNLVTIDEEKEVLKLYLELELMRFDRSFSYEIRVDENLETEEILMPSMLLQPYVENALWHGLMHKEGERKLLVDFSKSSEDVFRCTIDDNGIGRQRSFELKEQQSKTKRHESRGLKITKDRIDILRQQGYHARLEIQDKVNAAGEPDGTRVIVELSTFLKPV